MAEAEDLSLDGRTAIVTGAGQGLGRAEAVALARAGARVVLNDLPGPAVHDTAEEIAAAGGQAVVCDGDVGEWSTGERLVAAALDSFGGLDILVNNAGVLRDRMIFTMSEQEWDLVLRVHLRGHFVASRHATAYWREASKKAGEPVYARVVMKRIARAGVGPALPAPVGDLMTEGSHGLLAAYERTQAWLAGLHPTVEASIDGRSSRGIVRVEDRERYRAFFYWPVRGWNLLGDNTRFYAVGVLAWLQHLDWFFAFILLPMNAAFALLWLWQARADRRFLAGL